MLIKSNEERIKSVLNKVKHYGTCFPLDMANVIYLRYGKADIQEWVKLPNMIEFLAELDPDIQYLWKKMDKFKPTSKFDGGLFKGMDLTNPETLNYCRNLLVRLYLYDEDFTGEDFTGENFKVEELEGEEENDRME